MVNISVNNKLVRLFFIIIFFFVGIVQKDYAMDEEATFWQNYQKWFEYKKSQPLDKLQKEVILYLEKANLIFEKADDTWAASIKRPNLPNPQDALNIVNRCLSEFSRLEPPLIAKKHYFATLKLLGIIKEYHLKRTNNSNSGYLEQLAGDAIPYESIQSSEYFNIMRDVGLMANFEEELILLGLMNRNEIENKYSFFKEYKKNGPVICPKCGESMTRVRILYEGDSKYNKAIKEMSGDFLFGNKKFSGAPEFGYICAKCPMWYEEYPAQDNNVIIIRNWGWGLHELFYKKQKNEKS